MIKGCLTKLNLGFVGIDNVAELGLERRPAYEKSVDIFFLRQIWIFNFKINKN